MPSNAETWDEAVAEECTSLEPTPCWKRSSRGRRSYALVDLQRAAFLRMCRARLKPGDVGLPADRRVPARGLRREDVAVLAGVSVSWYAWLEQGRHISVSENFLERLCQALRLHDDERTYLYFLLLQHAPRLTNETHHAAPTDVLQLIRSLNSPAIVLNLCWDVLAWNPQQALVYRDYDTIPIEQRNLV